MSKRDRNKGKDYQRKPQIVANSMADIKNAIAKSNAAPDKDDAVEVAAKADSAQTEVNVATENSEAGKAARAEVVSEEKLNPLHPKVVQERNKREASAKRPAAKKEIAEASAKATNAVDLSTPEARHEVAEEVKALGDAIADGLKDEPEEDTPDEVTTGTMETVSPTVESLADVVNVDNGDNDPDDTNSPAATGAGEEISEDAVTNPDALIAGEGEVISESAAKADETINPQEEPALTGGAENGGAEVNVVAEPDSDNAITGTEVISDDTLVSELVGTSAQNEVTESASDEPATVTESAEEIKPEVAAKSSDDNSTTDAISPNTEPAVATVNTAGNVVMGLSDDQKRKLETAWLKPKSKVYEIKSREEIMGMIIAEYAAKATDTIKNGEVCSRATKLPDEIYQAHLKASKMAKIAAKAITDAPVVSENAPLSTDIPATNDAPVSSPEITSEAATENPATTLNGVEEATVAPVEISAKADETSEVINPSSNDETVSINLMEPVDTSKPELEVAAKESGDTEVPTAPEVPSEVADNNAEGVATDEPVVTSEEVPFDVDEIAAKAVDTAGTVGNSEVAATTDSNSQGEANNSGEVSNDAAEITPEPEIAAKEDVKIDAEATDNSGSTPQELDTAGTVETDATINNEVAGGELPAAPVITQETVNTEAEAEKSGKPKTGAQTLSHVGNITAFLQIANGAIESAYKQKNPDAKKYTQAKGKTYAEKWMKENGFDWTTKAIDYFEAAVSFCQAHGYALVETTDKGFNKGDFIRTLETFKPVFGEWSLFNELIAGVAIINNEHKASGREFICIGEPTSYETHKLRTQVTELTAKLLQAEKDLADVKKKKSTEALEMALEEEKSRSLEMAQIAEQALTAKDAVEGELLALTEELLSTEGAADTNPKVMSFHKRLLMEHKLWQKRQKLLNKKKLSLLNLLSLLWITLQWSFLQPQVMKTLRNYLAKEHLVWTQEVMAEILEKTEQERLAAQSLKAEQALISHRALFLETPAPLPTASRKFEGQYTVYKFITEDGVDEDEGIAYEDRVSNIRPLTPEDHTKLDTWRETKQADGKSPLDRKWDYYSDCGRHAINGHSTRELNKPITYNYVNTQAQDIESPKPANKPVYSESILIADMRVKEKPIEKIAEEISNPEGVSPESLGLYPFNIFAVQLSILEKLVRFSDATKDDDSNYHILITKLPQENESLFLEVLYRYIETMNKSLGTRINPMLYLASTLELAKSIGTEKHHCLDLFYEITLPFDLASEMAADLNSIVKCDAVVLRYPNSGNGHILIARELPESIASSTLPKFVRDYKGSDRYLKRVATHYATPYLNGTAFGKAVNYILVRKEYERADYKGNRSLTIAAHLNVYHVEELRDTEILAPDSVENAAAQLLGIPDNNDMPLIIEGNKPTSVIYLPDHLNNQLAA